MSDKLEKLTKQIYQEGVEKAKNEADKIIASAKEEKDQILKIANQQAQKIVNTSKEYSQDLKKRAESEVRMASQQSLTILKQKIEELICSDIAKSSAKEVFSDQDFIKKILETVITKWAEEGCRDEDILVKLPKNSKKDMQDFFSHKVKQKLDKGITVDFDQNLKSGFTISPKDGSYRIGFTEEDFQELIEQFLRSQIKEFLFDLKKDE